MSKKMVGFGILAIVILMAIPPIQSAVHHYQFKQNMQSAAPLNTPESKSMSDEEYGEWFPQSQEELTKNAKDLVSAQNFYYNGYDQWKLQYETAMDHLESMYTDADNMDRPADDNLASLHQDYVEELSQLLTEGQQALDAYDEGDTKMMEEHFQNQRTVAKEILPIMQEIHQYYVNKGL